MGQKRAFGSFAMAYGAHGQEEEDEEEFAAFNVQDLHGVGIWDPGATRSVGGYPQVQEVVDELDPDQTTLQTSRVSFSFAGGEKTDAKTRVMMDHEFFPDPLPLNVVATESTPILLGLDTIRKYGIVLDYYHDTIYSHVLGHNIPSVVLPSGHLGLALLPSE